MFIKVKQKKRVRFFFHLFFFFLKQIESCDQKSLTETRSYQTNPDSAFEIKRLATTKDLFESNDFRKMLDWVVYVFSI